MRGYSRGMRQRLAICAALVSDPMFLLLDEPFTGLDDSGVDWLSVQLRRVAGHGGSALLTDHTDQRLGRVVDRLGVLREGQITICPIPRAREGPPEFGPGAVLSENA